MFLQKLPGHCFLAVGDILWVYFLGSQNDQPHQPWPKSPGADFVEMPDMCTWILGISTEECRFDAFTSLALKFGDVSTLSKDEPGSFASMMIAHFHIL